MERECKSRSLQQGDCYGGSDHLTSSPSHRNSVHQQIYCRMGCHYPDVGACAAINSGDIKVKSGTSVEALTETGVKFADGTFLEADVICYATG